MAFEALHAGQPVGDYKLVRKIGAGGFGEVWLAEHEVLQARPVALKFPNAESAVAALKREGEIQHALEHPGIVKILGLSLRHSPPYIVMELIDGTSLEERLRDGPLPAEEVRPLFDQLLEALQFAHDRQVVHYDLKPSNILLNAQGRAFISDFGLSAVFNTQALLRSGGMTQTEDFGGSFDYMAPERKQGLGGDKLSDIYAVGVMLYRALTQRLPAGLELPSELVPGLNPAIDAVVKKAMHSQPAQRYSSASALREALDQALRGKTQPPPAPPGLAVAESAAAARAPRKRGGLLALLIGLLVLGVGYLDFHYRPLGTWTLLGRWGAPTFDEQLVTMSDQAYRDFRRFILLPGVDLASGDHTDDTRKIDRLLESSMQALEGVDYYKTNVGDYLRRSSELPQQGYVCSYVEVAAHPQQVYLLVFGENDLVLAGSSTDARLSKLSGQLRNALPESVFFMGIEELGVGLRNVRTRALELALVCQMADSPLRYDPSLRLRLGSDGFRRAQLDDPERRSALRQQLGTDHVLLGSLQKQNLSLRLIELETGRTRVTYFAEVGELFGDRLAGARRLSLDPKAIIDFSQLVDEEVDALISTTLIALHKGGTAQAFQDIEALAARDPAYRHHAGIAYCRGLVAAADGDQTSALTLFELAYERGQTDPELCRRLGNIYLRLAFSEYEKAHKCLWPDDEDMLLAARELAEKAVALENLPVELQEQARLLIAQTE